MIILAAVHLSLLVIKDWLLEVQLAQYDREEGMASILGKYNDRCRRPLAQEHGKAGAGWCSSTLSQLAESSGGPRKVLGVSRTPGVWSQRQMDEEVDKAGENRRLLWRSRKTLLGASGVPMAHCKLQ